MNGPLLEAVELAKDYPFARGALAALRGVDLRVEGGEFVAITGPSGCGKTTLLNLLGGLDTPTAGQVVLNGKRVDQLGQRDWSRLRRRAFGFVFQDFSLLPELTAEENVALPAMLVGSRGEARLRARALLERVGLAGLRNRLPHHLSGGEQQRVAVARALINDPVVVLADEPTGNLDLAASEEVLSLFSEMRDEERVLLLVTHDPGVASGADRIVELADGLVVNVAGVG